MGSLIQRLFLLCLLSLLAPLLRAGDLAVQVRDAAGNPLADAVVFAEPAGGQPLPAASPGEATMDQVGKAFVPRVLVVRAGDRVRFPNSDEIRHHVYSFSDAKSFELPLYSGTPVASVEFPVPGVVALGCNIHDWMRAHIVVLPTPFHAISDAAGVARIAALPAGSWQLRAWHADLPDPLPVSGPRVDSEAGALSAEIRLSLKPQPRIRRAPAGRRGDQY